MNSRQQFLALFRYLSFSSPWIWIFPVSFGVQPAIMFAVDTAWGSLGVPLASTAMLFTVPLIIAAFVFAPERYFSGTPGLTPQTNQQIQTYSGDFLLTRAIDRPVLFRSRTALFWALVLLPCALLFAVASWRPSLSVELPLKSPAIAEYYLQNLPGAEVVRTTKSTRVIASPRGKLALATGLSLASVCAAAAAQFAIYALLPLRWRKWIFWALSLGGMLFLQSISIPLFGGRFFGARWPGGQTSWIEVGVLWMGRHLGASLVLVAVCALGACLFAANRDKKVEYP